MLEDNGQAMSDHPQATLPDSVRGARSPDSAMVRALVVPCSLGQMLVAATARGVCNVALGDSQAPLFAELRARFPRARAVEPGADAALAALAANVSEYIDGARALSTIPLDLMGGSTFQQAVWRELCRIPRGSTLTYAEVARRIGAPRAVRAVGTACGRNPVAVVVPCHRVVRGDGSFGGYRWGLARKKQLLAREGALPAAMFSPDERGHERLQLRHREVSDFTPLGRQEEDLPCGMAWVKHHDKYAAE